MDNELNKGKLFYKGAFKNHDDGDAGELVVERAPVFAVVRDFFEDFGFAHFGDRQEAGSVRLNRYFAGKLFIAALSGGLKNEMEFPVSGKS